MSFTLREINLLKQRRKKSGPPSGVDFKRELTSNFSRIPLYVLLRT